MVYYSDFNITDNHSLNLYNAINHCRKNNEDTLVFEKGVYDFYPEMAAEDFLCVSNHDMYGMYRIAFLLNGMKDFTIDGGGSDFVFHDGITPFVLKDSENITIKNLSVDYSYTMMREIEVVGVADNYFDVVVLGNDRQYVADGMLHFYDDFGNDDAFWYMTIRSNGSDKRFLPESADEFRVFNDKLRFEEIGERKFRIYDSELKVTVGMHLITRGNDRDATNIAIIGGKNISIENVTMYKSYAMGVLAQKTENVSIDRMTVKAKDDCIYSLDADATHFVHCKGLVKVSNSTFSEQQDDALNVHGVFTRIVDKTDDYILIKYMHPQAKGLDIYETDDEISVLNPKSLLSKGTYKITDVEVVNLNYAKLYIDGGTDNIAVGDDVEDLTWSCDVIFENNRVVNNKGRGMLIAAKGKVVVKDNYFNTTGVAVLFESDGSKWYESGGTTDVEIINNTFVDCKYACSPNWGKHVIEVNPREETEEGKYYHKYISIRDNEFKDCKHPLLYADNIERVEFTDNEIINCIGQKCIFKNCREIAEQET